MQNFRNWNQIKTVNFSLFSSKKKTHKRWSNRMKTFKKIFPFLKALMECWCNGIFGPLRPKGLFLLKRENNLFACVKLRHRHRGTCTAPEKKKKKDKYKHYINPLDRILPPFLVGISRYFPAFLIHLFTSGNKFHWKKKKKICFRLMIYFFFSLIFCFSRFDRSFASGCSCSSMVLTEISNAI